LCSSCDVGQTWKKLSVPYTSVSQTFELQVPVYGKFQVFVPVEKIVKVLSQQFMFFYSKNLENGVFASISVQNIVLHTEINNLGII